MMHQSIATIDSPEFINLQPLEINPLMSRCEIKVLYLGENRNHSYITKEVATDMAKTLRGAPIVGYYKEENEDFADHGQKITFDDEGVKFECMTKPYGFVAPDAQVWFQKFEDTDDFGNKIEREYLMTTGYLWTGQYEECKSVIDQGRPQSMELDEENLKGHWATNNNTGVDFFIINDAIFSKLCILGEDVEPCFEGSSITAQKETSNNFTLLDNDFKKTLYSMMQDLKFALEGGQRMENEAVNETVEEVVETPEVVEETAEEEKTETVEEKTETVEEETTEAVEEEQVEEPVLAEEIQDSIEACPEENFACNKDDEHKKYEEESEEESKEEEDKADKEEEDDKEEDKKDYSLLYSELQAAYSDLETKYQALVEFKNEIDNEKKDALINSFYMLSEEDKADVIANKANYSLDEIEAKLSVICVRKRVNFELAEEDETKSEAKEESITYNLSNEDVASVPAWINAVRNTRDSIK